LAYNLGVVGIGHWFERLHAGMVKTNEIRLLKIAGASPVESKLARLKGLGVEKENYYRVSGGKQIPGGFFDDLDLVHISDPNEFHADQTLQSLRKGKITVTEKTFGANKKDFIRVIKYAETAGAENRLYLHLHYAHKILTINLGKMLRDMVRKYGKVVATSATFFEKENQNVDRRRLWIFEPKNGGIFMDWVHPFEIYYKGALAKRFDLRWIKTYAANPSYDRKNPTAVHSHVDIGGPLFSTGASADIRVAIGLGIAEQRKCVRFIFEEGQCLDLEYINSETEYLSPDRGIWTLRNGIGGELIGSGTPSGPTPSDILVNDMLYLCRGKNPGFTIKDIVTIFEPQWKYQEMIKGSKLISDKEKIGEFVSEGLANAIKE
jgi:hypothetical protein